MDGGESDVEEISYLYNPEFYYIVFSTLSNLKNGKFHKP